MFLQGPRQERGGAGGLVDVGWMVDFDVVANVVGWKSELFFVEMREPMVKRVLNLFKLGGNGSWGGNVE
jgi:hypothetical protein